MIVFTVELHQFRFKVVTYVREDYFQLIQNRFCEYVTPVFCYKDQMHMHIENAVSSMSNIIVFFHRPSII